MKNFGFFGGKWGPSVFLCYLLPFLPLPCVKHVSRIIFCVTHVFLYHISFVSHYFCVTFLLSQNFLCHIILVSRTFCVTFLLCHKTFWPGANLKKWHKIRIKTKTRDFPTKIRFFNKNNLFPLRLQFEKKFAFFIKKIFIISSFS